MRDLILPFLTEFQKRKITLTEFSNILLDFDIEIDNVAINDNGNLCFEFSDKASDASYAMEIK